MASLRSLPGFFSQLSLRPSPSSQTVITSALRSQCPSTLRSFTTTPPSLASNLKKKKAPVVKPKAKAGKAGMNSVNKPVRASAKARAGRSESFAQIKILRQNMFSPAPPPLRMARQRHLRHWTIHRAWLLFKRKQKEELRQEKERMHWGMFNACEELRKTVGPMGRGEGYLYRVALEKKGVWHTDAVPIEYARGQTDSPAKEAWDHAWKR